MGLLKIIYTALKRYCLLLRSEAAHDFPDNPFILRHSSSPNP